ncbi:MAG: Lrp/AsnC family transcriptional regulator [Chitinophagales bacterium]
MILDAIDSKILNFLKKNGRVPYSSIAKEVGLTAAAVGQRVQKMVLEEVIEGFSVQVNPEKMGIHLQAIITLKLHFSKTAIFNEKLKELEEVQSCYRVTGEDCMIMKVHFKNNAHLVRFLDKISVYGSSKTNIIIDELV